MVFTQRRPHLILMDAELIAKKSDLLEATQLEEPKGLSEPEPKGLSVGINVVVQQGDSDNGKNHWCFGEFFGSLGHERVKNSS
jgi:hypothetical protein